jgi:hypothetical protein
MTMCYLFKIQNFEVLMYFQAQFITRLNYRKFWLLHHRSFLIFRLNTTFLQINKEKSNLKLNITNQFQKYSNGVNQSRRCDRSPQHPEEGMIPSVFAI